MKRIEPKHWFLGTALLSAIIYLIILGVNSESIYKNGVILSAFVVRVNPGSPTGSNVSIGYYFFYKGQKFYGGTDADLNYSVRNKLLNNYFPALVDTTKPSNNALLIDTEQWKSLNKTLPDSIVWIKQYYR